MSNLEVIQIVASCVNAFHNGADFAARLQTRDNAGNVTPLSPREQLLQEMLQESMSESGTALSNHFKQEQQVIGNQIQLILRGDNIAKEELLFTTVELQNEIWNKLGRDHVSGTLGDDLKSLLDTAIAKRQDAMRSLTLLRQRILTGDGVGRTSGGAQQELVQRASASIMAESFVDNAVNFTRSTRQKQASERSSSMSTITQTQLIPEIRADDIDALTIQESMYEDDRFTMAPEAPYRAVSMSVPSSSQHAPQPRHLNRFSFSSAASMRAAQAPEPTQPQASPAVPLESLGPYFPPRSAAEGHSDHNLPMLPPKPRRDRPSVPESHVRSDSLPLATRVFSNMSLPSPSSSPKISEPDSAISLKMHSKKPYCSGAVAASEDFINGFMREFLPTLPGSDKKELCWKCKECDYNASDSEGQLFERIEFKYGVRFRFKFLARSHVPYHHPKAALRPKYKYGCLFCSAEGKQSATYPAMDTLMEHIRDKHRTHLTPEVREKTKCIIGKIAEKDEVWDCNLADVSTKGGGFRNFLIHAVTSLPT